MKYAWSQQHSDSFPVSLMCQVLQVSKKAYFAWKKRVPGPRQQRTERIRRDVQQVFEESNQIYGRHNRCSRRRKHVAQELLG